MGLPNPDFREEMKKHKKAVDLEAFGRLKLPSQVGVIPGTITSPGRHSEPYQKN